MTTSQGAHHRPARSARPSTAESTESAMATAAAIFTCPEVPVRTMMVATRSAQAPLA